MQQAKWTTPLLQWFSDHHRPMPWRDDPSPYKVWISEVMLQQTQVATVIPYFERFLTRFPTVQQLANAPAQAVLRYWEGLGYYSRARNLHTAAKQIAGPLQGHFPTTAADWKQLPGIGDYTGAAIASIANGQPEPAVDGNVLRVFSRLYGIRDDITQPATRDQFRDQLRPLIRPVDPSAFNQAIMELGALICRPRSPRCTDCPIQPFCKANRDDSTDCIPHKPRKTPVPHHHEVAVIIHNPEDEVLLYQREEAKLLGGLWAFPQRRRTGHQAYRQTAMQIIKGLLAAPDSIHNLQKETVIKHAFSHFSRTIHVFSCKAETVDLPPGTKMTTPCWIQPDKLKDMPLSKVDRTIANLIV